MDKRTLALQKHAAELADLLRRFVDYTTAFVESDSPTLNAIETEAIDCLTRIEAES